MTMEATSMKTTVRNWSSAIAQMVAVFLLVMAAKGAIAEPFYVPSGSMEPTLMIGDALLASKYPYGYSARLRPTQCRAAADLARSRRAAGARRRGGVPLAGRSLAGLGQARCRPARRSHPDARWPAFHQWRRGAPAA